MIPTSAGLNYSGFRTQNSELEGDAMKRYFSYCGVALLLALPLHAQQPAAESKIVLDVWDAVYLDGAKMGYQRTTVEERQRDGQKIFHTTRLMHITLKRYEGVITQRLALSTDET